MRHAREDYNRRVLDVEALIPENEPVFLLRAQDSLAPELVEEWANTYEKIGGDEEAVASVRRHADFMRRWQNMVACKLPNASGPFPFYDVEDEIKAHLEMVETEARLAKQQDAEPLSDVLSDLVAGAVEAVESDKVLPDEVKEALGDVMGAVREIGEAPLGKLPAVLENAIDVVSDATRRVEEIAEAGTEEAEGSPPEIVPASSKDELDRAQDELDKAHDELGRALYERGFKRVNMPVLPPWKELTQHDRDRMISKAAQEVERDSFLGWDKDSPR